MGVSEMWVNLIEHVYTSNKYKKRKQSSIEEILDIYKEIDEKISGMWRENGHPMLLHHLNALFGYKEVEIKTRNDKGELEIFPCRF